MAQSSSVMLYSVAEQKDLGAYYTGDAIADFIARWAVRPGQRVLDPSCGDGAFLKAVLRQCPTAHSVVGVEISERQAHETEADLGTDRVIVKRSDFFDFNDVEKFDAVLGNPPFIRYQSFPEASREKALFRCLASGVRLNKLSSSWAHFTVVASQQLSPGGRLGFVLPTELLHARYAKPVLSFLARSFAQVIIITFKERLFPDLSQDTLILLAAGYGQTCANMLHVDAESIEKLNVINELGDVGRAVDPEEYLGGRRQIKENYVDPQAVDFINDLVTGAAAFRLGDVLTADIGYVTGSNDFFHISRSEARRLRLPQRFLNPSVYRGRSLQGLKYTVDDWIEGEDRGESGYLLHIRPEDKLSDSVEKYLVAGIAAGHNASYKCSIRKKWYAVPHVYRPEGFLTSMSGERPSVVVNEANVVASNSLHILRSINDKVDLSGIAFSWLSSITSLSIELEGHALGGGMLKLEPREAERVAVVALHRLPRRQIRLMDRLIRNNDLESATDLADGVVCADLGISKKRIRSIRSAAMQLRARRRKPA